MIHSFLLIIKRCFFIYLFLLSLHKIEKGMNFDIPNFVPEQNKLFDIDEYETERKGELEKELSQERLIFYNTLNQVFEEFRKSIENKNEIFSFVIESLEDQPFMPQLEKMRTLGDDIPFMIRMAISNFLKTIRQKGYHYDIFYSYILQKNNMSTLTKKIQIYLK